MRSQVRLNSLLQSVHILVDCVWWISADGDVVVGGFPWMVEVLLRSGIWCILEEGSILVGSFLVDWLADRGRRLGK